MNVAEIKSLADRWFAPIPRGPENLRRLTSEDQQVAARVLEVRRPVPAHSIYKAWHIGSRNSPDFEATDLISDLLGSGHSSPLFKELVLKKRLFAEIGAFITGDMDPGLLIVSGKLMDGVTIEEAEAALMAQIHQFLSKPPSAYELRKVKNRVLSGKIFSDISVLNKAMNLAFYAYIGNVDLINSMTKKYRQVTAEQIHSLAKRILDDKNCSTLYYLKEND